MTTADEILIGGSFEVLAHQALPECGAGLPAFAVRDHRHGRSDLMALRVARNAPARPLPLGTLSGEQIDHLLLPIAHGRALAQDRQEAWFVITRTPPGPPLLSRDAWLAAQTPNTGFAAGLGERALIEAVLRPAALVLDRLSTIGVTHRAIRPDNVFQRRPGEVVTIGPAWAAPPAALQPALFEPPYSAICHPAGRGEGSIADDVYALGVLLIVLALGEVPLAGLPPEDIIRRKLERGSFHALTHGRRLPASIADIARGMLAEDPEHRPPPVLLADPMAARSRRVAARPPQRAQTALELGGIAAWDARVLAHAMTMAPEAALRLLRSPELDHWLRRSLGEPLLAARIEEVVRSPKTRQQIDQALADALLLLRCISLLDPLSPVVWCGLVLFPDGLGPLSASATPEIGAAICSFVLNEAGPIWADVLGERVDPAVLRLDSRHQRVLLQIPGWAGGLNRLRYSLNPLLPCDSPLLGPECVARLSDLLPALERHGATSADFVVDEQVAAFIAARFKGRMDSDFATIAQTEDPDIDPPGHRGLAQLRVLARLADNDPSQSWPHLAACALRSVQAATQRWRSQTLRSRIQAALAQAAQAGALMDMVQLLTDDTRLRDDAAAASQAEAELAGIDAMLSHLSATRHQRAARARQDGLQMATAVAVIALVLVVVASAGGLALAGL